MGSTRISALLGWFMIPAMLHTQLAIGQGLPPLFARAAHEAHVTRTLAEFPKMTFLENLVVDGSRLVFTSHEEGLVYQIVPGAAPTVLTRIPGKVTGIALAAGHSYLITAFDTTGRAVVHHIDRGGAIATTIIKDAVFLNGIERVAPDSYLMADSYKGVIWQYQIKTGQARVWLDSSLLKRSDNNNPMPAANGIRRHGDQVLVSNTAKMTLLRVPIRPDGSAGEPSVWKERINIDDFAVARDGSVWAATHIYNNVLRIAPNGTVTVVADAAQGLTGSTSVALSADGKTAYVTTNGGMFLPPPSGVQGARLISIATRTQ